MVLKSCAYVTNGDLSHNLQSTFHISYAFSFSILGKTCRAMISQFSVIQGVIANPIHPDYAFTAGNLEHFPYGG